MVGIVFAITITAYAHHEFAAILTGNGLAPPVNTGAKGVATFHINPN